MKQPLNEQFRRMQKLAGIITEGMEGGGMPSTAMWEGDEMDVVGIYHSFAEANEAVKGYLDPAKYKEWWNGDGKYLKDDLANSTLIVDIMGPGEEKGSQPPLLVSFDYMFDYEGGGGAPFKPLKVVPLPQATAGEDAEAFQELAARLGGSGYSEGSFFDPGSEEPSAILIFNSKLANDPAINEFEKNLNFDDDEEY